jgi:hypothetical protein
MKPKKVSAQSMCDAMGFYGTGMGAVAECRRTGRCTSAMAAVVKADIGYASQTTLSRKQGREMKPHATALLLALAKEIANARRMPRDRFKALPPLRHLAS